MADRDHDSDAPGAAPDDALAAAEEVAEREAAAETAADPASPGSDSPKITRPRARTSTRPAAPKAAVAARDDSTAGADRQAKTKSEALSGDLVTASSRSARPVGGESDGPVSLSGSGAAVVNARTVDVHRGGIGRVQAVDVAVTQGGIGLARGERVSVEMGGIGAAIGNDVRVTQGGANMILARDVRIEQAGVRTIIANNVHVERTTGVLIMIARHVEGDVRTLLDWRGAIAFGAAFGVVVSFFRRRR
jgi:hypothetical protein